MPALQVKDCPEDVYERLRACAAGENRSIAQQTLTILEEYLGLRAPSASDTSSRGRFEESAAIDYLAKRREAIKRLNALPAIPVAGEAPNAAAILESIRTEEAR